MLSCKVYAYSPAQLGTMERWEMGGLVSLVYHFPVFKIIALAAY
jgi:hypothetical protein